MMTDLAWSIQHREIGTRAVRGFTDAHRARAHARDHFLKALERWDALHPAVAPASFRARLDAEREEIHCTGGLFGASRLTAPRTPA
ncbi:MAG: hypothetical protein QME96_17465, partial [Myxococcota bacterium]|nr:hypothetical protein [Myxococcota bacterium]